MGLVNTEKANIYVKGIPLKTHRITKKNIMGYDEGEDFKEHKPDIIPKERRDNPEVGDWCGEIVIQVRVFDGTKWEKEILKLRNIPDEQIILLGPEYYTDKLMKLKYHFQL